MKDLSSKYFYMLLVNIALFAALELKGQTAVVSIQPADQNVLVDSVGTIQVSISNVSDLHSYSVTLTYNSDLAEVNDINELNFFAGASTLFLPNINPQLNQIKVDASILGTAAQSGSGELFEVKFIPVSSGIINLEMPSVILRDSQNQDIPFQASGGIIRISPLTDIVDISESQSDEFILNNYPNPFNNSTIIKYQSKFGNTIHLRIFSILGKEVYSQIDNSMSFGEHTFYWNGKSNSGLSLPSGIYLISIIENNELFTKKISLLK